MAGKHKKASKNEKRIAVTLVGVLFFTVLTTLVAAVPGFESTMRQILGIDEKLEIPFEGLAGPGVHMIDIGQGDAFLLEDSGEFALVDAGPPEGRNQLLLYLAAVGVNRLEYIFMSHPHGDHIGGMQAVLQEYPVNLVILPDFTKAPLPTTKIFENVVLELQESEIKTETAQPGAEYPLGQGSVLVLQDGLPTQENYNYLSLMLLFKSGNFSFLTAGDAEKESEKALLAQGVDCSATVFKASHHGSKTSNTADFIQAIGPEVVLVSCAKGNPFGMPHSTPLRNFEQVGAQVLTTADHGNVVVRFSEETGLMVGKANDPEYQDEHKAA